MQVVLMLCRDGRQRDGKRWALRQHIAVWEAQQAQRWRLLHHTKVPPTCQLSGYFRSHCSSVAFGGAL